MSTLRQGESGNWLRSALAALKPVRSKKAHVKAIAIGHQNDGELRTDLFGALFGWLFVFAMLTLPVYLSFKAATDQSACDLGMGVLLIPAGLVFPFLLMNEFLRNIQLNRPWLRAISAVVFLLLLLLFLALRFSYIPFHSPTATTAKCQRTHSERAGTYVPVQEKVKP